MSKSKFNKRKYAGKILATVLLLAAIPVFAQGGAAALTNAAT
ncbi:TPA: plasmid transfer protein, partial [Elizabethkingia anophelis]|nr:plasmid transfer protein [Elizabethkingia anophelis]HAY3598077.1 plasmid transfer protein [Elizabethkingia anophelis]